MTITGVWVTHPLYGPQITCEQAERRLPRDEAEMVCYLASGILKGVGQATAERMVDAFGADTLRVLEEEPGTGSAALRALPLRRPWSCPRLSGS